MQLRPRGVHGEDTGAPGTSAALLFAEQRLPLTDL